MTEPSSSTEQPPPFSNGHHDQDSYEFVFGFGSIINSSTHATWQTDEQSSQPLEGRIVRINTRRFGYARYWNFRSSTGFTALGVSRLIINSSEQQEETTRDMNGVLFRVPSSMMPGFDRREAGYDKMAIPIDCIDLEYHLTYQKTEPPFQLQSTDKVWIYVPRPSHCLPADENHPLLQSYVDTVLQGCLQWGGETFAEDFVLSTGLWSSFFLNDTPNSRRPWLFRKEYDTIDRVLKRHSNRTKYADRKHPEEFASTFLLKRMRGTWSLPRRNACFTGRDSELGQIHARLTTTTSIHSYNGGVGGGGGVAYLEVTGFGGVGKSSICTEYCYRHFPSAYGLIVWLNAESAEALVADYRQLLADLADVDLNASNKENTTEEVIGEVKTRLFRSTTPWLLVFDNLEDRSLLRNFVPRGAASGSKGHVLVTTRLFDVELGRGPSTLVLGCLSPDESVEMLQRALGPEHTRDSPKNEAAAREICERLGHLPLALGMAAAYMQRCDVACTEYVDRYVRSEQSGRSLLRHQAGRLHDYNLTVTASLSLSLKAIEKESQTASDILRLLCWLGPDQITKAIIRALLKAKYKADEERILKAEQERQQQIKSIGSLAALSATTSGFLLLCGLTIGSATLLTISRGRSTTRLQVVAGILASCSLCASAGYAIPSPEPPEAPASTETISENSLSQQHSRSTGRLSVDEFEQSDLVWNILKSFSILTIKEGKGTMHRLLSQSLRASQSPDESCYNLSICVESMPRIWIFQAKDTETWQSSLHVVEHVKSLVTHSFQQGVTCTELSLRTGILSKEAGVFSAMALNGFLEAQGFLELALKIFEKCSEEQPKDAKSTILQARAEALHELGRVLRYQGNFIDAEETLLSALSIRKKLANGNSSAQHYVADTLHELGVLEVKKHNLDSSQTYLTEALELRQMLGGRGDEIDADWAATLHQLATVNVARKPPLLDDAEKLLQEALRLSRQIGQRAATLKQLARVSIRQGFLDTAEGYLRKALELYIELYGERAMHMNVAAVKFQQGALALQRDQLEQAWIHYSECLRIRRHVYAYARPLETDGKAGGDPLHLEVSCVLHELGCVAFAQGRFSQSLSMLQAERSILEKLEGTSMHIDRLLQSRLTNLTWLRKCAKELGDEEAVTKYTNDRLKLKGKQKERTKELSTSQKKLATSALQDAALHCRLAVRQYALVAKCDESTISKQEVLKTLSRLGEEIARSPSSSMEKAARQFRDSVSESIRLSKCKETESSLLQACDTLRDALRKHGIEVNDRIVTASEAI